MPKARPRARKAAAALAAEPADASQIKLEEYQDIPAPHFWASQVTLQVASADATFVFQQVTPVLNRASQAVAQFAVAKPVAVLTMSVASAKDLSLVLSDLILNYEKDWGTVETAFMRRRRDATEQS